MVGLVRISGFVGFVSVKLNVVCCSYSHLRPHPMRDVFFNISVGFVQAVSGREFVAIMRWIFECPETKTHDCFALVLYSDVIAML